MRSVKIFVSYINTHESICYRRGLPRQRHSTADVKQALSVLLQWVHLEGGHSHGDGGGGDQEYELPFSKALLVPPIFKGSICG